MSDERAWFGQPRGLTILVLTNMWEQFSYYGMRALLVYYMTKQLMLGQGYSSFIYGAYTATAYFTPILGGAIADRYLGKRRAIIIGGSIMAAGHFMMTFAPLFYVALATIAIGNGLFLPSLPSQVGDLYRPDDPRRSWAFNVYYVGVNIGGFLAPLLCGTLGEIYGWHWGFGAAGIGMAAGLVIYIAGQKYLPDQTFRPKTATDSDVERGRFDTRTVLILIGVALSVTVFRAAYEQSGNTVVLWTDSGVDRHIGSFDIPMTWFQSLNPLFVMLLTPPLLAFWRRRAEAGREQSDVRKMATGALMVAGSFLLLAAIEWLDGGQRANWLWLVLFFLSFTVGELYILPIGLGLFARLAPIGLGATTVAAWFLTIFSGSLTAGLVGALWSRMSPAAFFVMSAGFGVAAMVLLRLISAPTEQLERNRDKLAKNSLTIL